MSTPRDVAVLVGSLRKDSFNRKLALALAAMAPLMKLRLETPGWVVSSVNSMIS